MRIVEHIKLNIDTQTHSHLVGLLWTSDQQVAEGVTFTTHNKHTRRTSMLSAGLEPTIPNNQITADLRLSPINPTCYVMHHQQFNISTTVRFANTEFLCFVFIWEQTATCATYSINWLVFITDLKSVYNAVRTESLNKAVCASSVKG
jgi:hypothetical protein